MQVTQGDVPPSCSVFKGHTKTTRARFLRRFTQLVVVLKDGGSGEVIIPDR